MSTNCMAQAVEIFLMEDNECSILTVWINTLLYFDSTVT